MTKGLKLTRIHSGSISEHLVMYAENV